MPTRVAVDDDEQQIQDLIKEMRRLRSRLATTAVKGTHDEFTAAATPSTTYTLTYIPLTGTCLMALNGHVQREGTDYTVDADTGIVTVSATQASGDKITFRYLVTDWLIARSLTPDSGAFSDNFNRPDSATIGTASDGGTWLAYTTDATSPVLGIQSNKAIVVSGSGGNRCMYRDLGSTACDISVDMAFSSFARGQIWFALDPVGGTAYRLDIYDSPITLYRMAGAVATSVGTFTGFLSGSTQTIRVTYNPSTGVTALFIAGVSKGTVTDGSPLTSTANTGCGFFATQPYYVGGGTSGTVNTGETFDNYSAAP